MGYAPNLDMPCHLMPVDFISETIIKISFSREATGKVFNLSKDAITWIQIIQIINNMGYSVKLITFNEWYENHLKKIDKSNILFPLLPVYRHIYNTGTYQLNMPYISNTNVLNMLESLNITCPKIDAQLFKIYFNFLKQCGFI